MHHPGDWLYIAAAGTMVAMTTEAYAEASELLETQAGGDLAAAKARGVSFGEVLKTALDVLVSFGRVRVELREVLGSVEGLRWPVYALVPVEARQRPQLRVVEPSS